MHRIVGGIHIKTLGLVGSVYIIGDRGTGARDSKRCDRSAQADEAILKGRITNTARKIAGIIYSQEKGVHHTRNIVFSEGAVREEEAVRASITSVPVDATDDTSVIYRPSLGQHTGVVRLNEPAAEFAVPPTVEAPRLAGRRVDHRADDVAVVINLLWLR